LYLGIATMAVVAGDNVFFMNAFMPKLYRLGQISPHLSMTRNTGAFFLLGENLRYKNKKQAKRKMD
jgi:hypothetical protein